jgi:glycopeptide antibiotics resistance protein
LLRTCYVTLLLLTLLFTLYDELYLRRWLFHRFGSNSFVAGSLPNFLAVVIFSFAVLSVKLPLRATETLRPIAAIVIGLTLYEVAQIWMPNRVFDWNDISATFLGGVFSWLLAVIAQRLSLISRAKAYDQRS